MKNLKSDKKLNITNELKSANTDLLYKELFVSAKHFLAILENPKNKIRSTEFIPPKLGVSEEFGGFKIKYDR